MALRLGCDVAELDLLPPTTRRLYLAAALMDDLGGELRRHAELRADLHNLGLKVLAAGGAKIEESEFRTADDYLPVLPSEQEPARPAGEVSLAALKHGMGFK